MLRLSLNKIFTFIVFIAFSSIFSVPNVRLSKEKIKKGEPLYLELEFQGKPSLEVPQKIITQNNVTLEYLGSQDNLSIVNGKVSQEKILKFRVVTSKDGKLQTPNFTVLENGSPINVPSKTFEVSKEKYVHQPQNLDDLDSIFDRILGPNRKPREQLQNLEDIHILFKLNKQRVYVGETLVGYYLFYLQDMNGWFLERNQQSSPEFPFFTSELLTNVSIEVPLTEEYKGVNYNLFPYQREIYLLTPLRKGKHKIGKTNFFVVDGGLETLFSQKSLDAQPAEVLVLDLPDPKPQNFSGEVGNYKIQIKTKGFQVFLGEPWQVELEISGYGTGLLFSDPLTQYCQSKKCNARISFLGESRERKFVRVSEGNYGFKTTIVFSYSIFPIQEGELKLGEVSINYFNPESESYEESSVSFPILQVLPRPISQESSQTVEEKSFYIPLLLLLLSGSLLFLLYSFREEVILFMKGLHFSKLYTKVLGQQKYLELLDKQIGNKTGVLLKNYLLSKEWEPNLVSKIVELKSEHPNKKMLEIYKTLKKEDKEELSQLIEEHFTKGEKL